MKKVFSLLMLVAFLVAATQPQPAVAVRLTGVVLGARARTLDCVGLGELCDDVFSKCCSPFTCHIETYTGAGLCSKEPSI